MQINQCKNRASEKNSKSRKKDSFNADIFLLAQKFTDNGFMRIQNEEKNPGLTKIS